MTIYCFSQIVDSHFVHLQKTLAAIIDANIQVSAEKTKLFVTEAHVLGHVVGQGLIRPDYDKTEVITNMTPPRIVQEFDHSWGWFPFSASLYPAMLKLLLPSHS